MKIVTLDVETTGLDPVADRVIQLAIKIGDEKTTVFNFNPGRPISPGAAAVHGITDADVAGYPSFVALADDVAAILRTADVICGYNVGFDISFLSQEFLRSGVSCDLAAKLVVDPFTMWASLEPRNLVNAYKRYVDQGGFDNAHDAGADVDATYAVLCGMLKRHDIASNDYEKMADLSNPDRKRQIGCKHFIWNDDGSDVLFNFGKHKGVSVTKQLAYVQWMLKTDFAPAVHVAAKEIVKGCRKSALVSHINSLYPFKKGE